LRIEEALEPRPFLRASGEKLNLTPGHWNAMKNPQPEIRIPQFN